MVELFAQKIVSVDGDKATINIELTNVGVSGYIVHKIDDKQSTIIKSVVVTDFDKNKSIATLKISDFKALKNDALPKAVWNVEKGDEVVLAFGYDRGLLIVPDEELYYKITKQVNVKWIHPDLFATMLSFNGHPTPLKSDFQEFSKTMSVGLIFFFLDDKLYMVDAKSFKVLTVVDTPFKESKKEQLPFYTRVKDINSHWWSFFDAGSEELKSYEPYYKKLIGK